MIFFRKLRQSKISNMVKLFRTKPDQEERKFYIPHLRKGLLMLTTTSACLWYNSYTSPTSGRRRLDLFSPKLRESSSKVLLAMFIFLLHDQKEGLEEEGVSYKERLTKLMLEHFLKRNQMVDKSGPEYHRVARIADRLTQRNLEMELHPPQFHITAGRSVNAFSLARHIVLTKGTLDMWTDNQLAFIIGHEMAHHALDHHMENLSWLCVEMVVGLMVVLHAIIRRVLVVAILWILLKPIRFIVSYPERRKGEFEADDLGMEMMARACYDVREIVLFWQVVQSIDPTSTSNMAMMSDHPSHTERKDRMVERMEKMVTLRKEAGCDDLEEDLDFEMFLRDIGTRVDV